MVNAYIIGILIFWFCFMFGMLLPIFKQSINIIDALFLFAVAIGGLYLGYKGKEIDS